MSQLKIHVAKPLERLALSNKPTLIITQRLQQQIDFLHKKVGRAEWSGELITREEGTIHDLGDWKIICEDIWLADVGSPGFTGYQVDQGGFKAVDIVDMYEKFPGLLEGTHKNHHIHTHHDMGAFFSGTDESQLEDRGAQSNYFMMLVVDFKKTYKAKVAFKADIKGGSATEIHFANNSDELAPLTLSGEMEREVLVVMECDIKWEEPADMVDEEFKARYEAVDKAIKEEAAAKRPAYGLYNYRRTGPNPSSTNSSVGRQNTFHWADDADDNLPHRSAFDKYQSPLKGGGKGKGKKGKKSKKKGLMELNEQEWKDFNREAEDHDDFELRHATALVNAIINKEPGLTFVPVPNRLYNVDFELKTENDKVEWVMGFISSIEDYMGMIWPEKSTLEHRLAMMHKLVELLTPYMYTPLVRLIVEGLADEIVDLYEEVDDLDEMEEEDYGTGKVIGAGDMDEEELSALGEATLEVDLQKHRTKGDPDWSPLGEANLNPSGTNWSEEWYGDTSYPDNVPQGSLDFDNPEEPGTDGIKTVRY